MFPRRLSIFAAVFAFLLRASAWAGSILYVDDSATGPVHDGSSWCNGYPYLQDALDAARASGGAVTEIRVAQGTYKPDQGANQTPGDRLATFELVNAVALRGGYAGCSTGDPDLRNIPLFETVLSGDLDGDDTDGLPMSECCRPHGQHGCASPVCEVAVCHERPACCDPGKTWSQECADFAAAICTDCDIGRRDNTFYIVTANSPGSILILDGVTLTKCQYFYGGSALRVRSGEVMVQECTFRDNRSRGRGSAVLHEGGQPSFVDCLFEDNGYSEPISCEFATTLRISKCKFQKNVGTFSAGVIGSGAGRLEISESTFIGNRTALRGGALSAGGTELYVARCSFFGNHAGESGGAVMGFSAYGVFVDCIFSGNSAGENGGAVSVGIGGVTGSPSFANCTFSANTATGYGGGLYNSTADGTWISNSILWGNADGYGTGESAQLYIASSAAVQPPEYTCIQGLSGALGVANIGSDPMFVDADGADDIAGTFDDDLRLSPGSPCIDAAFNLHVPPDLADLDGDGDASESTPFDLAGNTRFFDIPETIDTGNGIAPIVDMGAYETVTDCNNNRVLDAVDIATGTSRDCDHNDVPDECDVPAKDCNRNGVEDVCESDSDGDGVINPCDPCPSDALNDVDGDGLCANVDSCPGVFNPDQADRDGDGIGDACAGPIPAVSGWALLVLSLLILTQSKLSRRSGVPINP